MMDMPGAKSTKAMDEGDRISGLDENLLYHIMSFLPVRDAVRTCVLSPKWRYLWLSMQCLNIDAEGFTSKTRFSKFVTSLLLSRHGYLKSFWLRANGHCIFLDKFRSMAYLWIRNALASKVEELGIIDHDQNDTFGEIDRPTVFQLQHCPFTSSYLKKLHLCYVYINNQFIKKLFSGCPVLDDLEMVNCEIVGTQFSSSTLKNLSIDYVHFPDPDDYEIFHDIVINMHNLVSLHIGSLLCSMPILVEVHSLATASVSIGHPKKAGEYSLQKDTRLFQVEFTNLTTLYLSDWCLHHNCKPLLYLLAHSPNLEKLTLKLMKLSVFDHRWVFSHSTENVIPFNCEKLKKIEIICPMGDRGVGMLVRTLFANIIAPPEINIKPY